MCGIGLILDEDKIDFEFVDISKDFEQLLKKALSQSKIQKEEEEKKKITLNANDLANLLQNRGPDSVNIHKLTLENNLKLTLISSVLFIRGKGTKQPLEDSNGNILMWNGEIFGGLSIPTSENDTSALMKELSESKDIVSVMQSIQGPWGFTYFQKSTSTLWFGRNFIGQRSLLLHVPNLNCPYFVLSSLSFGDTSISSSDSNSEKKEKEEDDEDEGIEHEDWLELPTSALFSINFTKSEVNGNVKLTLKEHKYGSHYLGNEYRPLGKRTKATPPDGVVPSVEDSSAKSLLEALGSAVKVRVSDLPIAKDGNPHSSRLGILFSGGIDSLILSALADKYVPKDQTIDLINVAFGKTSFDVPDRKTGILGLKELQAISNRKWNFVQVNVNGEEVQKHQNHITSLIYPRDTVMDITIGTALWFAARAEGILYSEDPMNQEPYKSQVKVLLNGLGADEQLAGYARHRTAFKHRGWDGLQLELEKDLYRLWKRNLGRDDRVISDLGREVRFPFLDENVISFLNLVPLYNICDLNHPMGVGDKMILRKVGSLLGLTASTSLAKRAIQFGSRINKVYFPNVSGSKINGASKFSSNKKQ